MRTLEIILVMIAMLSLAACNAEPKTGSIPEETTGSEGVRAEHEMPEPPKVRADDPRYEAEGR
jgi:hypothetical protein